jgi:MoaA/NifB/PqqE/SkfB family radical SAM enzyme
VNNYTIKFKNDKLLVLDILCNANCNLNCCCCFRQAPLCKNDPRTYKLDVFEKDLLRIKELGFKIIMDSFTLTGGEPFLNKDLFKYADIIEKIYPNVHTKIFTNGLYLEKCSDEYLQQIKDHKLFIIFSYYVSAGINYKHITERLRKFGIGYADFGEMFFSERKYKTHMVKSDLSEVADESKIEINYYNCMNNCICLLNGKLYLCSILPNIDKINEYFGTSFPLRENIEYVDIYKLKNPDEFFDKIGRPLDFCKYCNKKKLNFVRWSKSKMERSEWLLE